MNALLFAALIVMIGVWLQDRVQHGKTKAKLTQLEAEMLSDKLGVNIMPGETLEQQIAVIKGGYEKVKAANVALTTANANLQTQLANATGVPQAVTDAVNALETEVTTDEAADAVGVAPAAGAPAGGTPAAQS